MSDYPELDGFITKIQTAKNYNTKEIRITIQEADALAAAIYKLLLNQNSLSQQIIDLQNTILNGLEVSQDGGKF